MSITFIIASLLLMNINGVHLKDEIEDEECARKRMSISISWPNCESTSTKIPTCVGTCRSYDVVIPTAPYFEKQCSCCKSVEHSVKKRQLSFNCNGRMQNHTVFIPIIEQCVCSRCEVF